jgi:hypothetical protein
MIGIPYANACTGCYHAVICPVCGEHIHKAHYKGREYAEHWAAKKHTDRDARPFALLAEATKRFCT